MDIDSNNIINIDQPIEKSDTLASIEICPECGEGQVVPEGRCKHCILCGWSACAV